MKTWFKISSAKKATIVCYHRPILAYTLSLQCIELSVAIPKTMNGHSSLVLNVFNETQKNVIAYLTISQHIDGTDSRNPCRRLGPSYLNTFNTITADVLTTREARASAAMVLIWFGLNIPVSLPRELTHWGRVTHICISKQNWFR